MNIKIPIPEKVSTNAIYAGMHWRKRKSLADLYHESLIEHRTKRVVEYPVDVTYIFTFKGKTLDVSNCGFMQKMLEDGLVKWKILGGDTIEHVSAVHLYSQKGAKDEVEIIIT